MINVLFKKNYCCDHVPTAGVAHQLTNIMSYLECQRDTRQPAEPGWAVNDKVFAWLCFIQTPYMFETESLDQFFVKRLYEKLFLGIFFMSFKLGFPPGVF